MYAPISGKGNAEERDFWIWEAADQRLRQPPFAWNLRRVETLRRDRLRGGCHGENCDLKPRMNQPSQWAARTTNSQGIKKA